MVITVIVLVVFVAIALNILTCGLICHCSPKKHEIKITELRESQNGKMVYLVGGMTCRTEHVFDFILGDIPKETGVVHVDYLNSGLWYWQGVKQLREFVCSHPADNTFVSISMGYLFVHYIVRRGDKHIALNPCIGYDGIHPRLKRFCWLLPLVKFLIILLGWIAYIPLIKVSHGQRYSLALYTEQLQICASKTYGVDMSTFNPDSLVLSRRDNVVDNNVLLRLTLWEPAVHFIDTVHFGLEDNSKMYREFVLPYLS